MEKLITAVQEGDVESANKLVRLFYDEIYVYVYKFTYNYQLSMDLTQEIFIRMLKNIHKYKAKKGTFKSWLYKIAHNYVINYFNSNEYKNWRVSEEVPDYLTNDISIDKNLIENEDKLILNKALSSLEPMYKETIIMRYYQDLSIGEISSILEINENTVKTRLRRGLIQLRNDLGGELHE